MNLNPEKGGSVASTFITETIALFLLGFAWMTASQLFHFLVDMEEEPYKRTRLETKTACRIVSRQAVSLPECMKNAFVPNAEGFLFIKRPSYGRGLCDRSCACRRPFRTAENHHHSWL